MAGAVALPRIASTRQRLGQPWPFCVAVFVATRIAVATGMLVEAFAATSFNAGRRHARRVTVPGLSFHRLATRKDGSWFILIARHGYTSTLHPHVLEHARYSTWAFFPGFALLLDAVHAIVPLSYDVLSIAVANVVGLVSVRSVYLLADTATGNPATSRAAALLFAAWPGSAALDLGYSEGLYVVAAALALAALLKRRWWLGGIAGLVATGTRAIGIAVFVAAVVAATIELRRRRSWQPLVTALLTASGFGGFILWAWVRTGDPLIWRRAESLWNQRFDLGAAVPGRWLAGMGEGGIALVRVLPGMVGFGAVVVAVIAAVRLRHRLEPVLTTYTVVALAVMLGDSHVYTKPRFVLAVVPLFVWTAMWLRRRDLAIVAGVSSVALGFLTYGYLDMLTP